MKKKYILLLLVGLIVSLQLLSKNTKHPSENKNVIVVIAPKSPATIPILRMIEENSVGQEIKLHLYNDMDAMIAMISKQDYSILIAPVHTAANLKNKGFDISLLNVFNWGGMYLSATDVNCNSWADLKGKELYVPSKGAVPDILSQYFLQHHKLVIGKDLDVVYSSHAEIAQLLSVGTIKYAVDAQPFVTVNLQNIKNYKIISEYTGEWKNIHGSEFSMPGNSMIASMTFLSQNKEMIAVINRELANAIEWTVTHPHDAGILAAKYLNADASMIENAVHGFYFNYKPANDAQKDVSRYLNVLLDMKPESIGGKLPENDFYYKGDL